MEDHEPGSEGALGSLSDCISDHLNDVKKAFLFLRHSCLFCSICSVV